MVVVMDEQVDEVNGGRDGERWLVAVMVMASGAPIRTPPSLRRRQRLDVVILVLAKRTTQGRGPIRGRAA